jgi:hypothetical protein
MKTLFLAFTLVFGMAIQAQAISQTQSEETNQTGTSDHSIERLVGYVFLPACY